MFSCFMIKWQWGGDEGDGRDGGANLRDFHIDFFWYSEKQINPNSKIMEFFSAVFFYSFFS